MNNQEFLESCKSQALADLKPSIKSSILLFSQGFTHSGKQTGRFNDEYLRDGYIAPGKEKSSLLYFIISFLSEKYKQVDNQFIVPIIDLESAQHISKNIIHSIKNLSPFTIGTTSIEGREICCMIFSDMQPENIHPTIRAIGNYGALATKDTLFWLLSVATQNIFKPTESSIAEQHSLIDINTLLNVTPKEKHAIYQFYTNYIQTLINTTCTKTIPQQLLNRIFYKTNYVANNSADYEKFILGLELTFDDIIHILAEQVLYTPQHLFKAINQQIQARFNTKPTQISLTGSCMHAINIILRGAGSSKIYIAPGTYHEIYKSLNIPTEYSHASYVELDNHIPITNKPYSDQIVDLMIVATNPNVNRIHPGFGSIDINKLIAEQLTNRDAQPLTVIVDITMNKLNDPQLGLLFANFKKYINNGQLAIIFCTSLNKYFQVGFDRNAAGLSINFYNLDNFAHLHQDNCTPGFAPEDITLQIVTHSMKNGFNYVDSYYNIVHNLSSYIYSDIISQDLFNQNQPIYLDWPHTTDIYKKTWSFVVIRFADTRISDLHLCKLQEFLTKQGIYLREGFAFSQTTYTVYESATPPIVRISIGPDARASQFLALSNYLQDAIRDTPKQSPHHKPRI